VAEGAGKEVTAGWHSTGEPEASDTSYRLAIGQACQAELNAEAAAALRSIWIIENRYGLPEGKWLGALELALASLPRDEVEVDIRLLAASPVS
jgi:hypothetical protein